MLVKNYIGNPVRIYGEYGDITILPFDGRATVDVAVESAELRTVVELGDDEVRVFLGRRRVKAVEGLPDPEVGVLYLVGKDVAEAARVVRDDLVILGESVESGGRVLGFFGVNLAEPATSLEAVR